MNNKNFVYLNVSMSNDRADGHLIWKMVDNVKKYDCLHWCLPGVPDHWNLLLYNLLKNKYNEK
jgi:hypothetical protein